MHSLSVLYGFYGVLLAIMIQWELRTILVPWNRKIFWVFSYTFLNFTCFLWNNLISRYLNSSYSSFIELCHLGQIFQVCPTIIYSCIYICMYVYVDMPYKVQNYFQDGCPAAAVHMERDHTVTLCVFLLGFICLVLFNGIKYTHTC